MVQLVRLVSDSNVSTDEIYNYFQAPIELEPYSKIVFNSCDIDFLDDINAEEFIITSDPTANNSMAIGNGMPNLSVTLNNGTYTADQFLVEVEQACNFSGNGRAADMGADVQVKHGPDAKMVFEFQQNSERNGDMSGFWLNTLPLVTDPDLTDTTVAVSDGSGCALLSVDTVPRLQASFQGTVVSTSVDEFYVGATNDYIQTLGISDFTFGLGCDASGHAVMIHRSGGVAVATKMGNGPNPGPITINDGDTFTLVWGDTGGPGACTAKFFTSTGVQKATTTKNLPRSTIGTRDVDPIPGADDLLRWAICCPAGSNMSLSEIKGYFIEKDHPLEIADNGFWALKFSSLQLARYCGFLKEYPHRSDDKGIITSDIAIKGDQVHPGMMIVVDPFTLRSFDGNTGQQANIITVLPFLSPQDNVIGSRQLHTQAANLIKISLNNQFPINLQSIHVRMLSSADQTPLRFKNRSTVTILLYGPDE